MQVFNLCRENLGLISLTVCILCAFRQRSKFSNFQQFFHHIFWLKCKFWILMVPSERSTSHLSESIQFNIIFFIHQIYLLGEKLQLLILGYVSADFFKLLSKPNVFIHSDDYIYQTISSFHYLNYCSRGKRLSNNVF